MMQRHAIVYAASDHLQRIGACEKGAIKALHLLQAMERHAIKNNNI